MTTIQFGVGAYSDEITVPDAEVIDYVALLDEITLPQHLNFRFTHHKDTTPHVDPGATESSDGGTELAQAA